MDWPSFLIGLAAGYVTANLLIDLVDRLIALIARWGRR